MSETPKFTPGPWQRYERTDGGFVITTQKGLTPAALANIVFRRDLHEFAANAHLIAAAPELYEALEMVRDADEDCRKDGLPRTPDIARATIDRALAKAEGRS